MYGTIAQMKIKQGKMDGFMALLSDMQSGERAPNGYLGEIVYRMDKDANEVMLVVFFQDKASYVANADSPEQDQEYRKLRDLLDADPVWHDGEVIHQHWVKGG